MAASRAGARGCRRRMARRRARAGGDHTWCGRRRCDRSRERCRSPPRAPRRRAANARGARVSVTPSATAGQGGHGSCPDEQPPELAACGVHFGGLLIVAAISSSPAWRSTCNHSEAGRSHSPAAGFVVSFAIALVAGFGPHSVGLAPKPLLIAIVLTATSLGNIVPILKDAGEISSPFGQLLLAAGSVRTELFPLTAPHPGPPIERYAGVAWPGGRFENREQTG